MGSTTEDVCGANDGTFPVYQMIAKNNLDKKTKLFVPH